jgi:predicted membrane-bound mannosyltransferase
MTKAMKFLIALALIPATVLGVSWLFVHALPLVIVAALLCVGYVVLKRRRKAAK